MKFTSVFLLICLPVLCASMRDMRGYTFSQVKTIQEDDVKDFLSDFKYTCIYYFTRVRPELEVLYEAYDQVAGHISTSANVILGFVWIGRTSSTNFKRERLSCALTPMLINGEMLEQIKLKKPFTYDSIMGAILTSFVKSNLPHITSVEELKQMEMKNIRKLDIVLLYFKEFGTPEHRSIVEIAKAMGSIFQFCVVTKELTENLIDNKIAEKEKAAMWVLQCSKAKKGKRCQSTRLKREADLTNVGLFLTYFTLPSVIEIPSEYEENSYEMMVNTLNVYHSNKNTGKVKKLIKELEPLLMGNALIAMINIDQKKMNAKHGHNGETPAVSVQKKKNKPDFFTGSLTAENIAQFVETVLFKPPVAEKPVIKTEEMRKPQEDKTPSQNTMKKGKDDVSTPEGKKKMEQPSLNLDDIEPIDIGQILTQDDHVEEAIFRMKEELPLERFLILTDETFSEKTSKDELTFIVFYHSILAKGIALLWTYVEVEEKIKDKTKLAIVNCYDWTDVCTKENVTVFPTVRYYRNGKYLPYMGAYDTTSMVSTIKLLLADNPLEVKSKKALNEYIKISQSDEDTFMAIAVGLFQKNDQKAIKSFRDAASQLHGQVQFIEFISKEAPTMAKQYQAKTPCVIVLKPNDQYQPHISKSSSLTKDSIVEFVKKYRIPALPELTPLMYPILAANSYPVAVLFINHSKNASAEKDTMVKLSKQYNEINFCYIQVIPGKNVGHSILREYRNSTEYELPALSIVNHAMGAVYNFNEKGIDFSAASKWIGKIKKGDLKPSRKLTDEKWEPLNEGFNFQLIRDLELSKGEPITVQQKDAMMKITERQSRLREKHERLMQETMMEDSSPNTKTEKAGESHTKHVHSEL